MKAALFKVVALIAMVSCAVSCPAAGSENDSLHALRKALANERRLQEWMAKYEPIVETYVRNAGAESKRNDLYFLGRLDLHREYELGGGVSFDQKVLFGSSGRERKLYSPSGVPIKFTPQGFSAMFFPFTADADAGSYRVTAVGREQLDGTLCAVYDVSPLPADAAGMFIGRLWIDPSSGAIARLRGTFGEHWSPSYTYLHFDSWRSPAGPGFWIPASTVVQEMEPSLSPKLYGLRFQSITRIWDYRLKLAHYQDGEMPALRHRAAVDGDEDVPPIIRAMQKEGLLARRGEIEQKLDAIVQRILSKFPPDAKQHIVCRILLTMPVESFSVGNTIVVSRGLLELMPPGAAISPILAHEIAHIVLGQTDLQARPWPASPFDNPSAFRPWPIKYSVAEETQAARFADRLLKNAPAGDGMSLPEDFADREMLAEFFRARFGMGWKPVPGAGGETRPAERRLSAIPDHWRIQPWTNQLLAEQPGESFHDLAGIATQATSHPNPK